MTIIISTSKMIIDLAIGAPSHGKYVSNDLNSINKSV